MVNKVSEGLAFKDHRGRVLQRTQTLNWDTATDCCLTSCLLELPLLSKKDSARIVWGAAMIGSSKHWTCWWGSCQQLLPTTLQSHVVLTDKNQLKLFQGSSLWEFLPPSSQKVTKMYVSIFISDFYKRHKLHVEPHSCKLCVTWEESICTKSWTDQLSSCRRGSVPEAGRRRAPASRGAARCCKNRWVKHAHAVRPVISPQSADTTWSHSVALSAICRIVSHAGRWVQPVTRRTVCLQRRWLPRGRRAPELITKLCSCQSGGERRRVKTARDEGELGRRHIRRAALTNPPRGFILYLIVKGFERGHPSVVNRLTGESGSGQTQ